MNPSQNPSQILETQDFDLGRQARQTPEEQVKDISAIDCNLAGLYQNMCNIFDQVEGSIQHIIRQASSEIVNTIKTSRSTMKSEVDKVKAYFKSKGQINLEETPRSHNPQLQYFQKKEKKTKCYDILAENQSTAKKQVKNFGISENQQHSKQSINPSTIMQQAGDGSALLDQLNKIIRSKMKNNDDKLQYLRKSAKEQIKNFFLEIQNSQTRVRQNQRHQKQLFKQKDVQLSRLKQGMVEELARVTEEARRQKQAIIQSYQGQLKNLQNKCSQLNSKLERQQKIQTRLVSNSARAAPRALNFIVQQAEIFTHRRLIHSELVYQSDQFNQNIYPYLNNCQQQPIVIIFFSNTKNIFGLFTSHVLHEKKETPVKVQTFLFNATQETIFEANRSGKPMVTPVIFQDSVLMVGNRELLLKSGAMGEVRVYCGSIIGPQYYGVRRREKLTGLDEQSIPLQRVQLHRLQFSDVIN